MSAISITGDELSISCRVPKVSGGSSQESRTECGVAGEPKGALPSNSCTNENIFPFAKC